MTKPGERIAHPELIRECGEDGKGWRVDAFGNWWPCSKQDAHAAEQDRAAD